MGDRFAAHPQGAPRGWATRSTGEFSNGTSGENYSGINSGQFVLHAKAFFGNPYDGHTLGAVIEGTERLTGCAIERAYVDKGYRGHETTNPRRVFISGQKRGVFGAFRLLLAWLRMLLSLILTALLQSFTIPPTRKSAC